MNLYHAVSAPQEGAHPFMCRSFTPSNSSNGKQIRHVNINTSMHVGMLCAGLPLERRKPLPVVTRASPRPSAGAGEKRENSIPDTHPTTHSTPQNSDAETRKDDPVYVELFEVAGTEAEHGARPWEPLPGPAQKVAGPLSRWISSLDFSEPMTFDGEEKTEYDPLRDGPLRYLGYANELGEAFAAWLFPGGVPLSYAVAIGYVLFDTADKYSKTYKDAQAKLRARPLPAEVNIDKLVWTIGLERGVDTLVWQLIASVAAPGYTIHTVVSIVSSALREIEKQPVAEAAVQSIATMAAVSPEVLLTTLNKGVPTAMGLLAIPFIVHPIDSSVHALLNASLRPWLRRLMCEEAGGKQAGLVVCTCSSKDE